ALGRPRFVTSRAGVSARIFVCVNGQEPARRLQLSARRQQSVTAPAHAAAFVGGPHPPRYGPPRDLSAFACVGGVQRHPCQDHLARLSLYAAIPGELENLRLLPARSRAALEPLSLGVSGTVCPGLVITRGLLGHTLVGCARRRVVGRRRRSYARGALRP